MSASRHVFACEPIQLSALTARLAAALRLEQMGNWYLAGEAYHSIYSGLSYDVDVHARAKLLARKGTCFEICGQAHPAARAYEEAARLLACNGLRPNIAGELFNRAAMQFRKANELFFAGLSWRAAAEQFFKISTGIVTCSENYGPLPISALKSHLCGKCYEAAAAMFMEVPGEEMWAVVMYWEAGRVYATGIPNVQAFAAYRNALKAGIRYYGTLEIEKIRSYLPLTENERVAKLNPLYVMEQALIRCNEHHQHDPGCTTESQLATDRQMAATLHDFSVILLGVGNPREAGDFRSSEKDRLRRIYQREGRYREAVFYWSWKITSDYGESLTRWALTCAIVLIAFAALYRIFGLIAPVSGRFDYFYFSVVTFTTLGYGDIHPVGLVGKLFASLEVALGFTMFGLLLSFLSNRFYRS